VQEQPSDGFQEQQRAPSASNSSAANGNGGHHSKAAAEQQQRRRMADVMAAIKAAGREGEAALTECIRQTGARMDGHAVTAAVTRASRFYSPAHGGGGDAGGGSQASVELRAEVAALLRAQWRRLDGFGLVYCLAGMARLGLQHEQRLAAEMVGGALFLSC
jgi:hypothetical protein